MITPTPAAQAPPGEPERPRRPRYLDAGKLFAARVEADISQGALAARAGHRITQSHVSRWERGVNGASLPRVAALAAALGIAKDCLMPEDTLARMRDSGEGAVDAGQPG